MPIQVTCTHCETRFKVGDKFAGRKGPCPKCKTVIQIPELADATIIEDDPKKEESNTKEPNISSKAASENISFGMPDATPTQVTPKQPSSSPSSKSGSKSKKSSAKRERRKRKSKPDENISESQKASSNKLDKALKESTIKSSDIKIQGGEEFEDGPKDSQGRSTGKPIKHVDAKFKWSSAIIIGVIVIGIYGIAWFLGADKPEGSEIGFTIGILTVCVSPLITVSGNWLLSDKNRIIYSKTELWIRALICGIVYASFWGLVAIQPESWTEEGFGWFYIAPVYIAVGTAVAFLSFDFAEVENAFFHFGFFLLASCTLRWIAGVPIFV